MAEVKNWVETYEEAYKIASQKGILPVVLNQNVAITELSRSYIEHATRKLYCPLANMFLHGQSRDNIGTYIIDDDKKTLLACDEYSRTFILRATSETEMQDVINVLRSAGYTQNEYSEHYIINLNPQGNN